MLMTSFTTSSRRIFSLVCLDLFVYDFFLLYYRSPLCLESLFSRNLAVPSVNYPFSVPSLSHNQTVRQAAWTAAAAVVVTVQSSAFDADVWGWQPLATHIARPLVQRDLADLGCFAVIVKTLRRGIATHMPPQGSGQL